MKLANLDPDHIISTDLFAPPEFLEAMFDLVISFGVIEHCADTAGCIRACARYLKPGGTLISLIPNQRRLIGFLQKHVDRAIFDKHVPLSLQELIRAHEVAGLKELLSTYLCFFNFGVLDLGEFATPAFRR
jgi:2-polyprenyl-3-methyl-5-hydroxy-6-metoxy-1,4-benzoquinol methylase